MGMAVSIGSISAALAGLSGHAHRHWGDGYSTSAIYVRVVSLLMLASAIFLALFAGFSFYVRANMLQLKMDGPYDNRLLPVVISVVLVCALLIVFAGAVSRLQEPAA
jgi:hypothetical protein